MVYTVYARFIPNLLENDGGKFDSILGKKKLSMKLWIKKVKTLGTILVTISKKADFFTFVTI
jgi:hypothetical protein